MSARSPYGSSIKLPSLDNLFSTEEERQDAALEKVQIIPLSELHQPKNHPYQVRDDEEMRKLAESIKVYGVLTPAIARPRQEGGYEVVSGNRRKRGSELAGAAGLPTIVRDMDDDTAIILMVDSNCQRENVLPSEKARAYKMKLEAIKRKGGRPLKINPGQLGPDFDNVRSNQIVAEDAGESVKQVQRYIRLNELIPELQQMVDEKKLKFNPAVEISYLSPGEQRQFFEYIDSEGCTPTLSQAQKLKAASKAKTLTGDTLKEVMLSHLPSVKPQDQRVTIEVSQLAKYFPKNCTTEQMVTQILRLLEAQYRHRQRGAER